MLGLDDPFAAVLAGRRGLSPPGFISDVDDLRDAVTERAEKYSGWCSPTEVKRRRVQLRRTGGPD
jgi:hypothetical protein